MTAVTCADSAEVAADVITDCRATLDGEPTGIRVTWDDDEGHFSISAQAL